MPEREVPPEGTESEESSSNQHLREVLGRLSSGIADRSSSWVELAEEISRTEMEVASRRLREERELRMRAEQAEEDARVAATFDYTSPDLAPWEEMPQDSDDEERHVSFDIQTNEAGVVRNVSAENPSIYTMSLDPFSSPPPPERSRNRTVECSMCEREFNRLERHRGVNGRIVCPSCFEPWDYCNGCSTPTIRDDLNSREMWDGTYQLCDGCIQNQVHNCDHCGRPTIIIGRRARDTTPVCGDCFQRIYTSCRSCGEAVPRETAIASRGAYGMVCERCASNINSEVAYSIMSGSTRPIYPFGIEIEAEFDEFDEIPWQLSGYHYHDMAPRDFISGWRAETDSSLNYGGEFISPPYGDAESLAEVVWTYNLLRANGAAVPSTTGQHITVYSRDRSEEYQSKVQLLTMILEEALFALNGDYNRCVFNSYCVRLKEGDTSGILNKRVNPERRIPAYVKGDVIEFRYPPGTLHPCDLAMNVGLTQLIMHLASFMSDRELERLSREVLHARPNTGFHTRVMTGLKFIKETGWAKGGSFTGLPYNPHEECVFSFRDLNRGHTGEFRMPDAHEILYRMEMNLEKFYFSGLGGPFTEEMAEQATKLFK